MAEKTSTRDASLALQLQLDPAAGTTVAGGSIKATVVATQGDHFEPLVPITMQLLDNNNRPLENARFASTNEPETMGQTNSAGAFTDSFSDPDTDMGFLRAFVTDHPEIEVSYPFMFVADHLYKIDLTVSTNDEPADGKAANVAYAVVYDRGQPLPEGTPVFFWLHPVMLPGALSEKCATFPDGSKRTTVLSAKDPQDGISKATVSVVDTYRDGETATLNANAFGIDAATVLNFTKANDYEYDVALKADINGQPADGISRNKADISVSYKEKAVPAGTQALFYLPLTMFASFLDGTKRKAVTLIPNASGTASTASVEFVDTYKQGESSITLNAQCGGQDATAEFFFTAEPVYEYDLELNVLLTGQPADGVAQNEAEAVVSYKGAAIDPSVLVLFTLPDTLFAEFTNGQKTIALSTTPDADGKHSRVKVGFVDHDPSGEKTFVLNARCKGQDATASFYFTPNWNQS